MHDEFTDLVHGEFLAPTEFIAPEPTEFIYAAPAPVTECCVPGPDDCCAASDTAIEFNASLHGASSGKVQLCLDQLVPATFAACPAAVSPDPWAGSTPGLASLDGYHSDSDEELWEYVEVEPWPMQLHDEFVKEMESARGEGEDARGGGVQGLLGRERGAFPGGLLQVAPNSLSSGHPKKSGYCFG